MRLQPKSEQQRKRHAEKRDDNRRCPRGFELFQVGFYPRRKHYENYADFCKERNAFHCGGVEYRLSRDKLDKPEEYARKQHPYNLRQPEFFEQNRHKLGQKQYERKRQ